ncbi:MAG: hypothetical protein BroJett018_39020 [Chloroflexota bacterium]|nr:MAG: hypothetical protein BroJett018_39020 [Chloroflexota bacterium]
MAHSTTIELERILPADIYQRLSAEAERQNLPIETVVRAAITEYLADDLEDTPDDYIEAAFRQGWREAMTGKTIPAREALAALHDSDEDADDAEG